MNLVKSRDMMMVPPKSKRVCSTRTGHRETGTHNFKTESPSIFYHSAAPLSHVCTRRYSTTTGCFSWLEINGYSSDSYCTGFETFLCFVWILCVSLPASGCGAAWYAWLAISEANIPPLPTIAIHQANPPLIFVQSFVRQDFIDPQQNADKERDVQHSSTIAVGFTYILTKVRRRPYRYFAFSDHVHRWQTRETQVEFSPFQSERIAVATAQYFGLVGNGRLHVLDRGNLPAGGVHEVRIFGLSHYAHD